MTPAARNGWIDVLRALSALAVGLFHFNTVPSTLPPGTIAQGWRNLWSHGHWGVGVFFALSGYCLFPGWSRAVGGLDFLRRRARRIFPPYWSSLLLIALLALGVKLVTGVNDVAKLPSNAGAVAATVLLMTDPVTAIPTINWVYWTLSGIVAFYLLTALPLLASRTHPLPILVALHGFLCLGDFLFHPAPIGPLFFVRTWPVFGLGLALAVWQRQRRSGTVMLVISLLHATWLIRSDADSRHYLLVGVVTVALLALTHAWPFPSWLRPLAHIGEFSYSLYLVHVPLGVYLFMRLLPAQSPTALAHIVGQLLLLGATVAAARVFYLVAERPFQSRGRLAG